MTILKTVLGVSALLISGALQAAGPRAPVCRTADIEAAFRKAVAPTVGRADVAGFSVAAGIGDGYRWSLSWGMADLEQRVPMTPASKVRVGSVSKLLTSAALVRLAGRGTIDLDAPIQRYVPDFPEKEGPAITARLLSGHLAGIRHYVDSDLKVGAGSSWDGAYIRPFRTIDEAVDIFRNDDLLTPPGTRYSYSSFGWALLSSAMEKASGTPFLDLVTREVITPLGLQETRPDRAYEIIPDRAAPYEVDTKGVLRIAPYADRSYVWAGGAYLSTARDLVRFATAHTPGPFLAAADLQLLFTPQRHTDGTVSAHGIGWDRTFETWIVELADDSPAAVRASLQEQVRNLPPTAWHSGSAPGGSALLLFDPDRRVALSMVTNGTGEQAYRDVAFAMVAMYRSLADHARNCPPRP